MEYLEYYKITFGWTVAICYNLVYFVGCVTIIRWLWQNYFRVFLSMLMDQLNRVVSLKKRSKKKIKGG